MSREPFELDPDEARVRSLIRRSDGPVTVRPFRPSTSRASLLPTAAAGVGLLVVGLIVGTTLGARRQEVASTPQPTSGITATSGPTKVPSPTPSTDTGAPVSAGAVLEAGVLYVQGADDLIYRYDGRTGDVTAVSGRSEFLHEATEGVLALGRHGSAEILTWEGSVRPTLCGPGTVVDFARNGACAYRAPDGTVTIGFPRDLLSPRPLAPADWQVGAAIWDDAGSRVAFLRNVPGPAFDLRAHNALYLGGVGEPRKLYEPSEAAAYVTSPEWSPDGRWITVLEFMNVSNSIAADGGRLLLINVETGTVTDLGFTVGRDWRVWSPTGELAFIRGGGRQTWSDKRLVVRSPDGTETQIALPEESYVQLAPAWSASGHLAFVVGPSSSDAGGSGYMAGTGPGDRRALVLGPDASAGAANEWRLRQLREIRCPAGAVEGVRPSADGTAFLLLCREPGEASYPLSIWFAPAGGATPVPLIRGLGQMFEGTGAGGFGFYGLHPHLETIAAWSLAAR